MTDKHDNNTLNPEPGQKLYRLDYAWDEEGETHIPYILEFEYVGVVLTQTVINHKSGIEHRTYEHSLLHNGETVIYPHVDSHIFYTEVPDIGAEELQYALQALEYAKQSVEAHELKVQKVKEKYNL